MTEMPWYGGGRSMPQNWYDAEQVARESITGGGGFPTWGTGTKVGNDVANTLQFSFAYDASTGTVSATNTTNTIVTSDAALVGDPGNTKNPYLNSADGTIFTADTLTSDYLQRINGTNKIEELRNTFIAKGWLSGDEAKQSIQYGNVSDPNLAKVLSNAITEISFRNVAMAKEGGDYLTLEEGLSKLSTPIVKKESSRDGTYVDTVRKTYNAADYRKSVNDVYKEMTGRGASEAELTKFISMLKAAEAKNPEKTTTVVSGKNSTTTTSGGLSNDVIASTLEEQALKDPEAEDYTKATEFMDMFLGAIGEGSSISGNQ